MLNQCCIKQIKWGRSDQKQNGRLSLRDYASKLEIVFGCILAVILVVFFRYELMALCSFAFQMCGGEALLEIVDILALVVFCGWFVAYSNGEYGRLKKRDWQRFRSEFLDLYNKARRTICHTVIWPIRLYFIDSVLYGKIYTGKSSVAAHMVLISYCGNV